MNGTTGVGWAGAIFWRVLYGAWLLTEIYVLVVTRTRRHEGTVDDRASLRLLWVTIVGSIMVGTWFAAVRPPTIAGGTVFVRGLGAVLVLLGLGVRWVSIATLGRRFSANVAIVDGQTLETEGIYRVVRHPSYAGLLLVLIGLGVHTANWAALGMVTLFPLLALLYRIRVEEAAMRRAFAEAYVAYAARSYRLLPGVY